MNMLLLGSLAALGSAFGWAISTILIKVGMRSKSPVAVNLIRLYLVSAMYLAVLIPAGKLGEILSSRPEYLLAAFVSAQFGFVIGDYFYFNALNWMGVSRTVPVTSTYPLWTMLWAVLFLDRRVYIHKILGAVLIVLAIVIVRRAEAKEKVDPRGFPFALLAPLSWSIAIVMKYILKDC
jgi:DME family drug/metabolite transporter